jgi:signal transduction histidine kinase
LYFPRSEAAMRLASRIVLPFALVLVVVLVLGQWSLLATGQLHTLNVRLLTQAIPAARAEVVLAGFVPTLVRHHRHAVVLNDPGYQALHRRVAQTFRDQLAALMPLLEDFESHRTAVGVRTQFTHYVETAEAEWDERAATGKQAVSDAAERRTGEAAEALAREVEVLGRQLDQEVAGQVAIAGRLEQRARTVAWSAFWGSAIVGLGLVALATARIARPLRTLHQATEAIADGQYQVPLSVTTRDELGRLAGALEAMAQRLQRMESVKAARLASISHDLRSPLNSIGTAATLLESAPLDARQARWLHIIEADSQKLLRLTNQILDLGKARDGRLDLRLISTDLRAIVADAAEELRPEVEVRGLQLSLHVPHHALPLMCDAGRVQQVIVNLLSNAVKFTPKDGRVTVTATEQGRFVLLSVQDTGVGIPATVLPQLFGRYHRVPGGTEGTGLGLAIVKEFVEAHGGLVVIQSREGEGTRLDVKLPKDGPVA